MLLWRLSVRKTPSELIQLLNDAMKTIASQHEGTEIAKTLQRFVADFTQSDVAEVLLYEADENRFVSPVSGTRYSMIDPKGLLGKHFLTKKGGVYNHMISEKGFDALVDNPTDEKFRAVILYPVVEGEELIGMVRGWRKVGNRMAYSPSDLEMLASINDFLAKILRIVASGGEGNTEELLDAQTLREVDKTARKSAETPSEDQALMEFSEAVHDIRTPATTLAGFLELLEESVDDERLRGFIENALESARFINELTTSILDRIKFSRAGEESARETVASLKFFGDIANGFSATMGEKGIRYIVYIDPNLPREITVDGMRIRRVLNNLLSNAYKFTPEGKRVDFSIVYDKRANRLDIQVRDEGIGIDPERQEEIFEAFKQAEEDTYEKYGGTGLGLAIVARYVKELGGKLELESLPEKGSRFSFSIPAEIVDEEPSLPPFIDLDKRVVILTNDFDSPDAANVRHYLVASGLTPDRIMVTNQIVQTPTHAYCFAELASTELIESLRASGVKVLVFEDRLFTLSRDPRYAKVPVVARNTYYGKAVHDLAYSRSKRKALIIDDNKINLVLLRSMLEKQYIDIDTSMDGQEGYDKLIRALEEGHPYDIVLIDKHMPGLSGDEVLRRYREREKTRGGHIYAIYITGEPHLDPEEKALFDYCMTKPFGKSVVEDAIQTVLDVSIGR